MEGFSNTNWPWESYTLSPHWSSENNDITTLPFVGFGKIVNALEDSSAISFVNDKFKISRTQLFKSKNWYVPETVYIWPVNTQKYVGVALTFTVFVSGGIIVRFSDWVIQFKNTI